MQDNQNETHPLPVKLPGHILKELYKHSLVDIRKQDPIDPHGQSADTVGNTLGEHKKNILILVNYADCATIREPDLEFLLNILNACRLSLKDVLILNIHRVEARDHQSLAVAWKPTTMLLFGIEPSTISLPVHFPTHQIQGFAGIRFMHAPGLQKLGTDDAEKRKLWAALKQLFLN